MQAAAGHLIALIHDGDDDDEDDWDTKYAGGYEVMKT